jgi:hypothetical protein
MDIVIFPHLEFGELRLRILLDVIPLESDTAMIESGFVILQRKSVFLTCMV